jgi:hypothetical protein
MGNGPCGLRNLVIVQVVRCWDLECSCRSWISMPAVRIRDFPEKLAVSGVLARDLPSNTPYHVDGTVFFFPSHF